MYYHALMLSTLDNDRMISTWRALTDVWFKAIERQRAVQADAVRNFCRAHLENAQTLSEVADNAEFAIQLFSCVASEPLRLLATTAQLGEIAADAHRQTVPLLSRIQDVSRDSSHHLDQKERPNASWQPSTRKMQMMA